MNAQSMDTKILKETKNKIKVDFERTDWWLKFKLKYFNTAFIVNFLWLIFRFLILVGISYVILSPYFAQIMASFMSESDFADITVKLIPKYPTLDTYKAIIRDNHYFEAFLNTTLLSLSCALLQTFICAVIGYGLAKFKFKGNKLLFAIVVFTMIVPHKTLQLSMYLKFRNFDIFGILNLLGGGVNERFRWIGFTSLDMIDTFWPLVLLSIGGLAYRNGLYIFMMRQFYRGVPDELEESAYIDGYGVFRTFIKIILPLSIPMMVTIFLFAFSWQWTDSYYTKIFFSQNGMLLMPDVIKVPASMKIQEFGVGATYSAAVESTCGLMVVAPLIIIYLFCQRMLIGGIERSGIVG